MDWLHLGLAVLRACCLDRVELVSENLAYRQQLATYKHEKKRPQLRFSDRFLWVVLSRLWSGWEDALSLVQPATVTGWHRRGFRL